MGTALNRGKGQAITFLRGLVGHEGDECVIWPFSHNGLGYGCLGYLGDRHYAHRLMCEIAHGPAPADKPQAAHSCGHGQEGCVNPNHLSWKTNGENQLDRRAHGTLKPERAIRLTVTPDQIAQMQSLKGKMSLFKIAETLGVKRGVVEYWQKKNRPPIPLKESGIARERREARRVAFASREQEQVT
jgi:hypothetical protein